MFHQEKQGNQTKTRKPHTTMDLPTKNLTKAAVLGVDEKKFEERCSDIHLEIYCRFIWSPAKKTLLKLNCRKSIATNILPSHLTTSHFLLTFLSKFLILSSDYTPNGGYKKGGRSPGNPPTLVAKKSHTPPTPTSPLEFLPCTPLPETNMTCSLPENPMLGR